MYILEPEPLSTRVESDDSEMISVQVELAPGKPQRIEVALTQEAMSAVVDVLYRVGGRELVNHFQERVAWTGLRTASGAQWASALDLMANAVGAQKERIIDALLALDIVAQRVFRNELDNAGPPLRLSRYGLEANYATTVTEAGRSTYRALRSTIVALDAKRRMVKRWSFTIPENAPHAREEFKRDLEPYIKAYREAAADWPALAACGASLMALLGRKTDRDMRRWATDTRQNGTRLDDFIKEALKETWDGYIQEKLGFLNAQLAAASRASAALLHQAAFQRGALSEDGYLDKLASLRYGPENITVERDRTLDPETLMAEKHPLFRHPFLIHAALEELHWQPGDIGYAAAISVLRAAKVASATEEKERTDAASILGWSSLGFGVLAFIPVIGQLAVVAVIATSAGIALRNSIQFVDASNRRQAVGPLADRFGFDEPEAAGFIVDLLGLAADIGLPVLGKAIGVVLRPAGRLLAASRVTLEVSEYGLDLTGLVIDANSALLDAEIRRLGLDDIERSD